MEIKEAFDLNEYKGNNKDPKAIGEIVLKMAQINEIIDNKLEHDMVKIKQMIASINLEDFDFRILKVLGDVQLNLLQKLSYWHRDYLVQAVKGKRAFKLLLPRMVVDEVPDVCDLSHFINIIKDYYTGLEKLEDGDVIQLNPITHGQIVKFKTSDGIEVTKWQMLPSPEWLASRLSKEQIEYLDTCPSGLVEVALIGLASDWIPPHIFQSHPALQGREIPIPKIPSPSAPLPLEATTIQLIAGPTIPPPPPKMIEIKPVPRPIEGLLEHKP